MAASTHAWPPALGGLDREMQALIALARRRGARLALVGGSVRDDLLGRRSRDVDLVVEGDARALVGGAAGRAALAPLGGELHPTAAFDTVRWHLAGGGHLDLAGARAERYVRPGALPEVSPTDLETDLWRRDFAVNAMALVLREVGAPVALLDPTGGAADLARGELRALHAASFRDDPTRLWRGHRLAARLGWRWQRQTAVWARLAIRAGASASISAKRCGAELQHVLAEPQAPRALGRLLRAGLVPAWNAAASPLPACRLLSPPRAPCRPRPAGPPPRLPAAALAVQRAWQQQAGWPSACPSTPPSGPPSDPSAALWLLLALGQRQADVACLLAQASHLGGGLRALLLDAPARLRALTAAAVARPPPAALARRLLGLTPAERAVAFAMFPSLRPALRWWACTGQQLRTPVDGRLLRQRGHRPGPRFAPALAAAQQLAWQGGSAAAQLAAAEATLSED